jgi:hypothetical protein
MHAMAPASPEVDNAHAFADEVRRTLVMARSLVRAGKLVDLTGLDSEVAFVCARVLDLPPDAARAMRPVLMALRAELHALTLEVEQSHVRDSRLSPPNPARPTATS